MLTLPHYFVLILVLKNSQLGLSIFRRVYTYRVTITAPSALTATTTADETQVIEFGDLVLHHRGAVPQLCTAVLVVAGPYRHQRAVPDVAQRDHLECNGQRLVRPPVRGQNSAHEMRTARPDQLPRMFREEVPQGPFSEDVRRHLGVGFVEESGAGVGRHSTTRRARQVHPRHSRALRAAHRVHRVRTCYIALRTPHWSHPRERGPVARRHHGALLLPGGTSGVRHVARERARGH